MTGPQFVTVSTKCPNCGNMATLFLEQTWSPPLEVLRNLAGSRIRCRASACKKLFGLRPDDSTVQETARRG